MARLSWTAQGVRFFEAGVDRGVLYVADNPGVAWTGLMSVTENPSGGDSTPYYIDGIKYLNIPSSEEFVATLKAVMYPDIFAQCDGTQEIRTGLYISAQRRKSFGLSYRTRIGNDVVGADYAYKIHLVYNALAAPSSRANNSLGENSDISDFTWNLTTKAVAVAGYRRTAHLTIDSRYTSPAVLSALEDILYGTDADQPRLPEVSELLDIFAENTILTVIDHGDGTFTISGPDEMVVMLDTITWQVTSPSANYIDEDSYTISSL